MNVCEELTRLSSKPAFSVWRPLIHDTLSTIWKRVSLYSTGMKNGSPKRYPLTKSNAVSGNGRDWPPTFGPPYGRGRSSRAN